MSKTKKVVCIRVDEKQHASIRMFCAKKRTSIQKALLKLLVPLMKEGEK